MAAIPGGSNVYVPSHEASGKMVIDFSRNIKDFAVNKYTKLVKVDKDHGLYQKNNWDRNGLLLSLDGDDRLWRDGMTRPGGRDNLKEFEWLQYRTERFSEQFVIGDKAVNQASSDLIAIHSAMLAQQMMTLRTSKACRLIQTTGNHLSSHVLNVGNASITTGRWDVSTTARLDIRRSIDSAINVLLDDTLAAINVEDLYLVMGPTCAQKVAETQEIADMIKGSPEALAYIKGELRSQNPNAMFGLPPKLYNVNLIVEHTRAVTSKRRATKVVSHVCDNDKPFLIARPGGLEGVNGAPAFAAVTNFVYEEMKVETMRDKNNRRTTGTITDDYGYVLTSQEAIVLFNDVLT